MTHRLNYEIPGTNDFIIENRDGETVHFTSTGRDYQYASCVPAIQQMIYEHHKNGYHPDCILCQDAAKRAAEQDASADTLAVGLREAGFGDFGPM